MSSRKVAVVIPGSGIDLKQETDRQNSELRAYAKAKGYDVVEICRETSQAQPMGMIVMD